MPVKIELPDDWLSAGEEARLRRSLSAAADAPLAEVLAGVARAGIEEYREMLTGSGMPTRIDEARQRRLFHMIRHHYRDRIPSETEVTRAFHLTATQARALIRAVLARFRHDLGDAITDMLRSPLEEATPARGDGWRKVRIPSPWIADALNELLAGAEVEHKRLRRDPGMSNGYLLDDDAYDYLSKSLEMN